MPTPVLPTEKKKAIYLMVSSIVNRLFIVAVVTYFFLLLVETLWPGFASSNINLTLLLWFVIVSGVVSSIVPHQNDTTTQDSSNAPLGSSAKKNMWLSIFLGLLVGLILYWFTRQIGHSAVIVALAGGLLTIALAKLFATWENTP